jgi:hypothetical protein
MKIKKMGNFFETHRSIGWSVGDDQSIGGSQRSRNHSNHWGDQSIEWLVILSFDEEIWWYLLMYCVVYEWFWDWNSIVDVWDLIQIETIGVIPFWITLSQNFRVSRNNDFSESEECFKRTPFSWNQRGMWKWILREASIVWCVWTLTSVSLFLRISRFGKLNQQSHSNSHFWEWSEKHGFGRNVPNRRDWVRTGISEIFSQTSFKDHNFPCHEMKEIVPNFFCVIWTNKIDVFKLHADE